MARAVIRRSLLCVRCTVTPHTPQTRPPGPGAKLHRPRGRLVHTRRLGFRGWAPRKGAPSRAGAHASSTTVAHSCSPLARRCHRRLRPRRSSALRRVRVAWARARVREPHARTSPVPTRTLTALRPQSWPALPLRVQRRCLLAHRCRQCPRPWGRRPCPGQRSHFRPCQSVSKLAQPGRVQAHARHSLSYVAQGPPLTPRLASHPPACSAFDGGCPSPAAAAARGRWRRLCAARALGAARPACAHATAGAKAGGTRAAPTPQRARCWKRAAAAAQEVGAASAARGGDFRSSSGRQRQRTRGSTHVR